jgi:four helix bundle protein
MGVRRLEDLAAYQLAVSFKREVYAVLKSSPEAMRDWSYRDQLRESALGGEANIAEGFSRFVAAEIAQFCRYAVSSLREAQVRLKDGIDRGYFSEVRCKEALQLCDRAIGATTRFHQSLRPFMGRTRGSDQRKEKGVWKRERPESNPEP